MAIAFLETLAADFLEYEYLVSLGLIFEDGGFDDGTLYIRITELDLPFGVNEQDLVELDGRILRRRKTVDEDLVACFDLELLACNIYNCVHKIKNFNKFRPEAPASRAGLREPPGPKRTAKIGIFR